MENTKLSKFFEAKEKKILIKKCGRVNCNKFVSFNVPFCYSCCKKLSQYQWWHHPFDSWLIEEMYHVNNLEIKMD